MGESIKYTYKEVKLAGALTEKGRKLSLNEKVKKMAKEGWELEKHIDGGITKTSTATFRRDINYKAPKNQSKRIIEKIFRLAIYLLSGFILLTSIDSMYSGTESAPKQKGKSAIEKQEQKKQSKKTNEKTSEYANKILNIIYADMLRNEKHLKDFATTLSTNNAIKILEQSRLYNHYALEWATKHYVSAETWGAKEDVLIDDIISAVGDLAGFYHSRYDSIDEYFDNQIPSKLLEIKQNIEAISSYKTNVIRKAMTLAHKYNLKYNEEKNTWESKKE